jgi:cytidine deaminase
LLAALSAGINMNDLIASAQNILGEFALGQGAKAGTVAAALRTAAGNVYTGISLDMACGIGFCAEHSAIAEMLKQREWRISAIVAVNAQGILPPCGRCRELMLQVSPANAHTLVAIAAGKSVPLRELLPHHWLDSGAHD